MCKGMFEENTFTILGGRVRLDRVTVIRNRMFAAKRPRSVKNTRNNKYDKNNV